MRVASLNRPCLWGFTLGEVIVIAAYHAFAVAVAIAFIVLTAEAADPVRRGKIAAPQQPAPVYVAPPTYTVVEPAYKVHNWYVGTVGGYLWGADENKPFGGLDDTFHGGIVAGYLWRNETIGAGVEADYVVRDLGDFRLDDGIASIRGRLGMFVAPGTFLYGTAGVAEATEVAIADGAFRRGLVVGGGIEKEATKTIAVRAEVLHYRHANDYFEWGDDGSTAGRVALLFKF